MQRAREAAMCVGWKLRIYRVKDRTRSAEYHEDETVAKRATVLYKST